MQKERPKVRATAGLRLAHDPVGAAGAVLSAATLNC